MGTDLSTVGTDPDASTTFAASSMVLRAIGCRVFDLALGQQAAMPLQSGDLAGLEQRRDSAGHALDDSGLALLHGGEVQLQCAHADAMES